MAVRACEHPDILIGTTKRHWCGAQQLGRKCQRSTCLLRASDCPDRPMLARTRRLVRPDWGLARPGATVVARTGAAVASEDGLTMLHFAPARLRSPAKENCPACKHGSLRPDDGLTSSGLDLCGNVVENRAAPRVCGSEYLAVILVCALEVRSLGIEGETGFWRCPMTASSNHRVDVGGGRRYAGTFRAQRRPRVALSDFVLGAA
jgi:hypothetical protein